LVGVAYGHTAGLSSNLIERRFILKKNTLAGEVEVRGFCKPGEDFILLMKTVGAVLPPPTYKWLGFYLNFAPTRDELRIPRL
jgi:hypothetical protein